VTDPSVLTGYGAAVAAALVAAKETVGIATAELRFEGQGVEIVTPGIIVMLAPPEPVPPARGIPAAQLWQMTLFIAPASDASLADEVAQGMRIAQAAHMVVRRTVRDARLAETEPFAFVRTTPNNVICAVNYDLPFALFP
jgi:hypothetical protein